ncbi:MAG TPA: hypothetical protein HA315_00510 [Candidatus Thalassarchaeaceae archaeon]|jgi:hypothetical protein|nr:hypothetical protein [Euryarchaeota archaeon]DAC45284.1 MAG TPA: hypothetical protein D7H72_00500 [Candidatus Poseidoniales archaeon]HII34463.1 hypothetical protein [Candidatus Thalassarchaeaceae archaeon]|tara:strand:- start:12603 stop:13355 length:753 start_codon:yes stop_codon:yes gene_type:complete
MPDDDESLVGPNGMPLPPPPPGINLPSPPPLPPPPPPPPSSADNAHSDNAVNDADTTSDDELMNDFHSHWEKRKTEGDATSVESRDSMYGHIDRISSDQVGSLMDRFSDRFGSELDREIIVLRKKQQQDLLSIKPTVELISGPEDEFEDEAEDDIDLEANLDDIFPRFFDIVNNLLGDMDEDFIDSFVSSDDFPLFQTVGEDPSNCDDDTKAEFFSMINRVLGELPEEKIGDFVASPGFAIYQEMGEIYS